MVISIRPMNEKDLESIIFLDHLILGEDKQEAEKEQIKAELTLRTGHGRYYALEKEEETIGYMFVKPAVACRGFLELMRFLLPDNSSFMDAEHLFLIGEDRFNEEYYNRMGSHPEGILFRAKMISSKKRAYFQRLKFRRVSATDAEELWAKTYDGRGNIYKS